MRANDAVWRYERTLPDLDTLVILLQDLSGTVCGGTTTHTRSWAVLNLFSTHRPPVRLDVHVADNILKGSDTDVNKEYFAIRTRRLTARHVQL